MWKEKPVVRLLASVEIYLGINKKLTFYIFMEPEDPNVKNLG